MRGRRTIIALSVALTLGAGACKKRSTVDKTWAKRTYQGLRAIIAELDGEIRRAFAIFAPRPYRSLKGVEAKKAQDARKLVFAKTMVDRLRRHPEVMGWRVYWRYPGLEKRGRIRFTATGLRRALPFTKGSRTPAQGTTIDGRRVGWGTYAHKRKHVTGIEVEWAFLHGPAKVIVALYLQPSQERRSKTQR